MNYLFNLSEDENQNFNEIIKECALKIVEKVVIEVYQAINL